jgi:hypothetical protein
MVRIMVKEMELYQFNNVISPFQYFIINMCLFMSMLYDKIEIGIDTNNDEPYGNIRMK